LFERLTALDAFVADRRLFGLAFQIGADHHEPGAALFAVIAEERFLTALGTRRRQFQAAVGAVILALPYGVAAFCASERIQRVHFSAERANLGIRGDDFVAIPARVAVSGHDRLLFCFMPSRIVLGFGVEPLRP
jgi:hypothetical protein